MRFTDSCLSSSISREHRHPNAHRSDESNHNGASDVVDSLSISAHMIGQTQAAESPIDQSAGSNLAKQITLGAETGDHPELTSSSDDNREHELRDSHIEELTVRSDNTEELTVRSDNAEELTVQEEHSAEDLLNRLHNILDDTASSDTQNSKSFDFLRQSCDNEDENQEEQSQEEITARPPEEPEMDVPSNRSSGEYKGLIYRRCVYISGSDIKLLLSSFPASVKTPPDLVFKHLDKIFMHLPSIIFYYDRNSIGSEIIVGK